MDKSSYYIITGVCLLLYLVMYFTGTISNNWLFGAALLLGETVVLLRRRYLGLPLYPFKPKSIAKDFRERFITGK